LPDQNLEFHQGLGWSFPNPHLAEHHTYKGKKNHVFPINTSALLTNANRLMLVSYSVLLLHYDKEHGTHSKTHSRVDAFPDTYLFNEVIAQGHCLDKGPRIQLHNLILG
jgi:hypothetical protein